MPSYIQIANPNAKGAINDHVEITCLMTYPHYHGYLRQDFKTGDGPISIQRGSELFPAIRGESSRGWSKTTPLFKGVSLEEATRIAQAKAEELGIAMYLDSSKGAILKWHPKGWKPNIG
jgi:hypothetical protein